MSEKTLIQSLLLSLCLHGIVLIGYYLFWPQTEVTPSRQDSSLTVQVTLGLQLPQPLVSEQKSQLERQISAQLPQKVIEKRSASHPASVSNQVAESRLNNKPEPTVILSVDPSPMIDLSALGVDPALFSSTPNTISAEDLPTLHPPANNSQKDPAMVVNTFGERIVQLGDRCFKLTDDNINPRAQTWSLPETCPWVKTQSDKTADAIDTYLKQRFSRP